MVLARLTHVIMAIIVVFLMYPLLAGRFAFGFSILKNALSMRIDVAGYCINSGVVKPLTPLSKVLK